MPMKFALMAALVSASAVSATAMAEDCMSQPAFDPASFALPTLPMVELPRFDPPMLQTQDGLTARDLRENDYGKVMVDEQLAQAHRERAAMEQQVQQMMAEVQRTTEAFRAYRPVTESPSAELSRRDTYRDEVAAAQREQAAKTLATFSRPFMPEISGLKSQFDAERDAMRQQMDDYRDANRAGYVSHREEARSASGDPITAWRARLAEQQQAAADQQRASWRHHIETLDRCLPSESTAAAPSPKEKG